MRVDKHSGPLGLAIYWRYVEHNRYLRKSRDWRENNVETSTGPDECLRFETENV